MKNQPSGHEQAVRRHHESLDALRQLFRNWDRQTDVKIVELAAARAADRAEQSKEDLDAFKAIVLAHYAAMRRSGKRRPRRLAAWWKPVRADFDSEAGRLAAQEDCSHYEAGKRLGPYYDWLVEWFLRGWPRQLEECAAGDAGPLLSEV